MDTTFPSNGLAELQRRIQATIATHTEPKQRWRATRQLKWRMHAPQLGLWAGMSGLDIVPVTDPASAIVFDGRDNEEHKLRFYRATTGIDWQVECLP